MDVWLLNWLAAVEQHVSARGLHRVVLHLSDRCVVKKVPGPSYGTEAQSRVVTHVQVARVILEKAKKEAGISCTLNILMKLLCWGFNISVQSSKKKDLLELISLH